MLTLWCAPNTCAPATHIASEEAAAVYVARRLDFSTNKQQSTAYLKIKFLDRHAVGGEPARQREQIRIDHAGVP